MKIEIQEIDIQGITKSDARELRNEIHELTKGNLAFFPDKYPQLHELDKLLAGCFDSAHNGVHFISKRD